MKTKRRDPSSSVVWSSIMTGVGKRDEIKGASDPLIRCNACDSGMFVKPARQRGGRETEQPNPKT